jgi:hypothetical protein
MEPKPLVTLPSITISVAYEPIVVQAVFDGVRPLTPAEFVVLTEYEREFVQSLARG